MDYKPLDMKDHSAASLNLFNEDSEVEASLLNHEGIAIGSAKSQRSRQRWTFPWVLSIFLNVFLTCWIVYNLWPSKKDLFSHGILRNMATSPRAYHRFTDYSSEEGNNTATMQSLWKGMITDHGFVALDHEWAVQNRLPRSRPLPSDPSKGIYFIEAYHALHCVISIRMAHYHMVEHGNNVPLPRSAEHYSHCFDTLKQTLTCNAPDNLFAVPIEGGTTPYANDDGKGQKRQCRDWTALRSWATQNTPCIGDVQLNEDAITHHFCHGPDDGIRLYD